MKLNVKKFACVALSFSMIASLAACSKKDDKEKGGDDEATGCIAATETLMDAVVSLNAKKIKKLEKELGVDGDAVSDLQTIADEEFVAAVMEKASYEIDEDSLKEKKKTASVNVTVSMPDYEDAYDEAGDDIDDFKDALDSQKEKKYKTVDLTVKFDVEDEEYTLSNFDEICEDLFNDMLMTLPSGLMVHPTQTEPTDDTEPTDTTAALPTDTDPTDTTPAATDDTTSTTTSGPQGTLKTITGKKVELTEELFKAAVTKADQQAGNSVVFNNTPTTSSGYTFIKTGAAVSGAGVMYVYYQFESEDLAKEFAETVMLGASYVDAASYEAKDDYNFCTYIYSSMTVAFYQSGSFVAQATAYDTTEEVCNQVNAFAEGLFE